MTLHNLLKIIIHIINNQKKNGRRIYVIFYKILLKFQTYLFLPIGLVLSLLLRAIRPWVLIRIGKLTSERIGHFAADTELYLCEKNAGMHDINKRCIEIWYNNWPICNKQLERMWRRKITILPSFLLAPLDKANSWFNDHEIHKIKKSINIDRDVDLIFQSSKSSLSFTLEEEKLGQTGLEQLGIPKDTPWVCLIVRDSKYLYETLPWRDWSYHDYRNCTIDNYIMAAKKLSDLGYYVVRMGVHVKKKMKVSDPKIIDYACNGLRTDFMDIYLGANCNFCISNGTGYDAVPYIFRRPIMYIDHVPLEAIATYNCNSLSTSKRIKLIKENRFMKFEEIFSSGLNKWDAINDRINESNDIELVESSPEEINEAVIEMESRLKGVCSSSPEDEELQKKFWEIYPKSNDHGEIRSRMGTDYLKQNM